MSETPPNPPVLTGSQLAQELGESSGDVEKLQECVDLARALLDRYIADTLMDTADPVPAAIYRQALLAAAVEAWGQRQSISGYVLEPGLDEQAPVPVRVSADPLRPARPLLSSWCLHVAIA